MSPYAQRRELFRQLRTARVPEVYVPAKAMVATHTALPPEGEITIAMLRALCDLALGVAYENLDGYFQGTTPGRMRMRWQTMDALYRRGFINFEPVPGTWLRAARINETGRAKVATHPLKLELQNVR